MSTEDASIVVIEDDPSIADLIELYLRRDGYRVFLADNGEAGLEMIRARQPDLIVLDVGLPGRLSGIDVCREVRATSSTPIIMVTARDAEVDRVLGLEMGADDYVVKPFSARELVARVKAILRRSGATAQTDAPSVVEFGAIRVDNGRREATLDGVTIALATREFDLLAYLGEHRGLALSRRQLLDGVWGSDWVGDERTVDVHIRQLRKKLGDDLRLATVWGVGYRLD